MQGTILTEPATPPSVIAASAAERYGVKVGQTVRAGNGSTEWKVGEIVERGRGQLVANLHGRNGATLLHLPLHELLIVREARE